VFGDHDLASVLPQQVSRIAGLPAALDVEDRLVEREAAVGRNGHDGGRTAPRIGVVAKKQAGRGHGPGDRWETRTLGSGRRRGKAPSRPGRRRRSAGNFDEGSIRSGPASVKRVGWRVSAADRGLQAWIGRWSGSNRAVALILAAMRPEPRARPACADRGSSGDLSPASDVCRPSEAGWETARDGAPAPLREHTRMCTRSCPPARRHPSSSPRRTHPAAAVAGYAGAVRRLVVDRFSPGIQRCGLGRPGAAQALLYRVRAGRVLPRGESCAGRGRAGPPRGIQRPAAPLSARRHRSDRHRRGERPVADQDCIYLAVTDPPLHLTGPLERWVERFFASA
jgi:hypothetical protein